MNYLSLALILSILIYHALYNWGFYLIWGSMIAVYLYKYFENESKFKNSADQKWKMASHKDGGDPCVYSKEEIDLTELEVFLETHNKKNPEERLTLTHVCVRALGAALSETKRCNGVISFGHYLPVESVDISVLVDIDGKNLGNVLVKGCNSASLQEISRQLKLTVSKMKTGKDEKFNEQMNLLAAMPSFVMQTLSRIISYISYDLGLGVPAAKVNPYNFGMGIVTNVTTMNLDDTTAPLCPFTKAICVVVMNTPKMKPIVVNGEVKIRKVININSSFDHRFADGYDAAKMFGVFRKVFMNPEMYVGK